jgi:hypothetical protein
MSFRPRDRAKHADRPTVKDTFQLTKFIVRAVLGDSKKDGNSLFCGRIDRHADGLPQRALRLVDELSFRQ